MGPNSKVSVTLQLIFVLIYLSHVGGFESYLRLVGFGCEKQNIISDSLKCPSEGNFSVAGACDRFVRCVTDKIKNRVSKEPYMEFCDLGENYVRGRCTKISDPYDCPQSHCRWVREDTSTQKSDTTTLSPQVVVTTASENKTHSTVNNAVAKNQTANKSPVLKCEEIPRVQFDDAKTCPSEGQFVWLEDDMAECDLFVACKCQGGRMTAFADGCDTNETFTGGNCVADSDMPEDMRCPHKHCKPNDFKKIMDHSSSHKCPEVEQEEYPGDEHSHGHDGHEHDHHQSTTTTVSVLQPNHSLSSTVVPFFHSVILMLVSSLIL